MTQVAVESPVGQITNKLHVFLEYHAAKSSFVVAFLVCDLFGHVAQAFSDARLWHLDQLYGAVFGFSAIEIGSLLALYALLVSDTPTTRRLGNSKAFLQYLKFVRVGIWLSGITALFSMPILVISPTFKAPWAASTITASLWYGLSFAMFAALFRVVSIAPLLIEPRRNGAG
jgi:hypothetical protein